MTNIIEDSVNFLEKYKSSLEKNSPSYYRIDIILPILSKMESSEDEWNAKCQYLYPKYKSGFLIELTRLISKTPEDNILVLVENIYCKCAYFLREYILYLESSDPYD